MKPSSPHSIRAFTLLELLVVMAIMAILIGLATVSLPGITGSGKFNKALNEISGILEQGRSTAVAQDTYVWVALYEVASANNGPAEVYVAAFRSNDGTDPFGWTGSVVLPSPGIVGSTTFSQVSRIYHYKGLHLQTTTLPHATGTPNVPATLPVFQCTAQSNAGPVTLSGTASVYWVVQFTPTGSARNAANPIESIWMGLQPSLAQGLVDTHNIASLKVNGLTGLTTIYRE